MKTKKLNMKLALNKATVANLGFEVMSNVKGGYSVGTGTCVTDGGIICRPTTKCRTVTESEANCWTTAGEGGPDCTVNLTCNHLGCA